MAGFHELVFDCNVFEVGTFEGDDICEGTYRGKKRKIPPPKPVAFRPEYMRNYSLLTWEGKRARIEAIMQTDFAYYRDHLAEEYQRVLTHIALHGRA